MAEPNKQQIGDGADNYGAAAQNAAKAAKSAANAGKEATKSIVQNTAAKGAEATANAAAATVKVGVEGGKVKYLECTIHPFDNSVISSAFGLDLKRNPNAVHDTNRCDDGILNAIHMSEFTPALISRSVVWQITSFVRSGVLLIIISTSCTNQAS